MDGVVAALHEALDSCLASPLWARTPDELVDYLDGLHAAEQRLAAAKLAAVREIDASGLPCRQGANSAESWLRDHLHIGGGTAARTVKLARALDRELPVVAAGLAAGVLNTDQAQVLAAAMTTVPAVVHHDAETALVDYAATFGPKELGRLAERIVENVAPDLAQQLVESQLEVAEREAFHARQLHLIDVPGTGRVRVQGVLDREGAALVRTVLQPLSKPCGTPEEPDLRAPEQRRADALVEACRRLLAAKTLPRTGGDRPQLVLTLDYDKLRAGLTAATLDDGAQLSAATVRRLACDAGIVPVVVKGDGQVLDIGRERRLFSGHLRRALIVRDRGCAFPSCDKPPRFCDGHHVTSWLDHGPTCLDNGVLLCRHHHRLIHQGQWEVRIRNNLPEFIPPSYVDTHRTPIRNHYHRRP